MEIVLGASIGLVIVVLGFLLFVRTKDLPEAEPISPFRHLDERKASIYENLRDLQFEYRVGKLSDEDYQKSKLDLQKELAQVLAEVDRIKTELSLKPEAVKPAQASTLASKRNTCASCGARFDKSLKFCGECGKPMTVAR